MRKSPTSTRAKAVRTMIAKDIKKITSAVKKVVKK